jgi:hypothetical protein
LESINQRGWTRIKNPPPCHAPFVAPALFAREGNLRFSLVPVAGAPVFVLTRLPERLQTMALTKGNFIRTAVLAAVALFAGAIPAWSQTKLAYKFKEGEKLNYVLTQKMDMKMDVAGKEIGMEMNQNINWSWNTLEVKEGKAKILQKFDRIKFVMDTPMGKVEFDSKDGKDPEGALGMALGPIFKALAGMEFTVTMDSLGNITQFKIPEKQLKALQGAVPPGAPGMEMFTEEGLKQMTTNAGLVFPDEEVAKGKTWDKAMEMKMPFGKMHVASKYTYEGPETKAGEKLQKIALKANIKLEPDPKAAFAMKLQDQGTKGMAYFDNQAGRLRELNMTQNMKMEINAAGQTLTQNLKQTVTVKLVNDKGD